MDDELVQMNLCPFGHPHRSRIDIPIEPNSNLPVLFDVSTTDQEKDEFRPHFCSRMSHQLREDGVSGQAQFAIDEVEYEFEQFHNLLANSSCVSSAANQNLTLCTCFGTGSLVLV